MLLEDMIITIEDLDILKDILDCGKVKIKTDDISLNFTKIEKGYFVSYIEKVFTPTGVKEKIRIESEKGIVEIISRSKMIAENVNPDTIVVVDRMYFNYLILREIKKTPVENYRMFLKLILELLEDFEDFSYGFQFEMNEDFDPEKDHSLRYNYKSTYDSGYFMDYLWNEEDKKIKNK